MGRHYHFPNLTMDSVITCREEKSTLGLIPKPLNLLVHESRCHGNQTLILVARWMQEYLRLGRRNHSDSLQFCLTSGIAAERRIRTSRFLKKFEALSGTNIFFLARRPVSASEAITSPFQAVKILVSVIGAIRSPRRLSICNVIGFNGLIASIDCACLG